MEHRTLEDIIHYMFEAGLSSHYFEELLQTAASSMISKKNISITQTNYYIGQHLFISYAIEDGVAVYPFQLYDSGPFMWYTGSEDSVPLIKIIHYLYPWTPERELLNRYLEAKFLL